MKPTPLRVFPPLLLSTILIALLYGPAGAETVAKSRGQTVYATAYSWIYHGNRQAKINLAVTLSIRNASPDQAITITAVDYYGPEGKREKVYQNSPVRLNPLAAVNYVVHESDPAGGSGAGFLVKWRSEAAVVPPVIQAVMIGTESTQGISFLSEGRVVEDVGP
ncbi:MAG: DUF3124 domain-containing protein [Proteobacteria bacterium]|nr:DUF3124 domain-containing protein [Pseudomonadota bacterium]